MKYMVTVNGKKYEVEVEEASASNASATAPAQPSSNPVPKAPQAAVPQAPEVAVSSEGGEPVKAPMPGTILDIRVSPGQSIKKGDVLFILEAMKMENEIMSGSDAVVANIATSKGAMVNTGDILAVLKLK
jgi:biotin carboxyl carrier protein